MLKKGSSTSLHAQEQVNDYAYQIDLSNVNQGHGELSIGANEQSQTTQQTTGATQAEKQAARKGGPPAKNNLFKEVIVEDDENDVPDKHKPAYRSRLSAHHEQKQNTKNRNANRQGHASGAAGS